jgi:hypothetical protein
MAEHDCANDPGLAPRPTPLYRVEADAVMRVTAADDRALRALFASVKARLGGEVRAACWPFRHNGIWTVSVDLQGRLGDLTLSIATTAYPQLPGVRGCELPLYVNDWTVLDPVDAYYLVAGLMAALDLSTDYEDWPFLGLPRVIETHGPEARE